MTTSPPSGGRRRPRRRWPKFLLGTVAAVLVVSIALGGFVWWRFRVPSVGDEITPFNEYARSLQSSGGGEDGWPAFETLTRERLGFDIFAASPWFEESAEPYRLMDRHSAKLQTGELDDPRMRESIAAVESFAFLLPELDTIATTESFVFQFHQRDNASGTISEAMHQLLQACSAARKLNSLNSAHMRLAADREDWAEVMRRLTTGVRLGRHIGRTPLLISRVIGYAVEGMSWSELECVLTERTPSNEVIQDLLALCEELGKPPPLSDAIVGERFGTRGFTTEYLRDQRGEFDILDPDSWGDWLGTPSYRAMESTWRKFNDATLSVIDLPPKERDAKRDPTPRLVVEASFTDPFDMMVSARDGLLRQRAAIKILLHLNLKIAETSAIPAHPLAALPADLRVDPISGGTIVVDNELTGRFPYTLRWPVQSRWTGFDRVFTERRAFDEGLE